MKCLKVNNEKTRIMCEICSNLTKNTPNLRHGTSKMAAELDVFPSYFFQNFEHQLVKTPF